MFGVQSSVFKKIEKRVVRVWRKAVDTLPGVENAILQLANFFWFGVIEFY